MTEMLQAVAARVAGHRGLRVVFVSTLALLPLALVAVVTEMKWTAVCALGAAAAFDGLLRWAPLSAGRLLVELRDRSSQLTTLRAGLIAVAFLTIADMPVVAVAVGAGMVVSVLCRVLAAWLRSYADRTIEQGVVAGDEDAPWLQGPNLGINYTRWLTASEIASVVVLGMAFGGAADDGLAVVVAVAWVVPGITIVGSAVRRVVRLRSNLREVRDVAGRVAVYFAEPTARAYQLQQWLPVLDNLHESVGVLLIFRDRRCFDHFGELTDLPRIYARTFDDLIDVYDAGDHGVVLYVNNGMRNFQSLAWTRAIHAHINHGESDKTSLVTHQSRAYDRILVAGEAALRRMTTGLLEVDRSRVVTVGRPQLDYVDVSAGAGADAGANGRQVLVYAPTWEGENDANNFSSVDIAGVEVIRSLLAVPDATVLYKPHPRTPVSRLPQMRAAHRAICEQLEAAAASDPTAGHRMWTEEILPLLAQADVLVSDVSSVAVDHLYLRPDARMVLMDRGRDGGQVRASEIPIARSATVVAADQLTGLSDVVTDLSATSVQSDLRMEVRREYFGDFAVGESTGRFQAVVLKLLRHRDQLLEDADVSVAEAGDQHRNNGGRQMSSGAHGVASTAREVTS